MKENIKNYLEQYLTKEEKIARLEQNLESYKKEVADFTEALEELKAEDK